MDRNFNIDDSFNNVLVTPNNANAVSNDFKSAINFIDTTINQKNSNVNNPSSLPIGGTMKVEGKYPERNYIIFNIDLLSSVTPYSSNVYIPVTNTTITTSNTTNNSNTSNVQSNPLTDNTSGVVNVSGGGTEPGGNGAQLQQIV